MELPVPVDLVVGHTVHVDLARTEATLDRKRALEFGRNQGGDENLKRGEQVFDTFKVVPPCIGIVHQVNLEYPAKGVTDPDSSVGTDSRTTKIKGRDDVCFSAIEIPRPGAASVRVMNRSTTIHRVPAHGAKLGFFGLQDEKTSCTAAPKHLEVVTLTADVGSVTLFTGQRADLSPDAMAVVSKGLEGIVAAETLLGIAASASDTTANLPTTSTPSAAPIWTSLFAPRPHTPPFALISTASASATSGASTTGSGTPLNEICETFDHCLLKVNIDTDMQYVFTRPIVDHMMKTYDGVLKINGEVGDKKPHTARFYLDIVGRIPRTPRPQRSKLRTNTQTKPILFNHAKSPQQTCSSTITSLGTWRLVMPSSLFTMASAGTFRITVLSAAEMLA